MMGSFTKIFNSFAKTLTREFWRGPKYTPEFTNLSGGATLFRLKKDKKPWKIYKLRDTAYKSNAWKYLEEAQLEERSGVLFTFDKHFIAYTFRDRIFCYMIQIVTYIPQKVLVMVHLVGFTLSFLFFCGLYSVS